MPYQSYDIRLELVDKLSIIPSWAESTSAITNYVRFINQFPPSIIRLIQQLERTNKKIWRQKISFSQKVFTSWLNIGLPWQVWVDGVEIHANRFLGTWKDPSLLITRKKVQLKLFLSIAYNLGKVHQFYWMTRDYIYLYIYANFYVGEGPF